MNKQLEAALIAAALKQGPALAEQAVKAIAAGVAALVNRMTDAEIPPGAAEAAYRIVRELDEQHAEWPGEQRRRWARNRIMLLLGPTGDSAMADTLLQLALERARAGG